MLTYRDLLMTGRVERVQGPSFPLVHLLYRTISDLRRGSAPLDVQLRRFVPLRSYD